MMHRFKRLSQLVFIALLTIATLMGCEAAIELPVSKQEASQLAELQQKEVELITKEQITENDEVSTEHPEEEEAVTETEDDPITTEETEEPSLNELEKNQIIEAQPKQSNDSRLQQEQIKDPEASSKKDNVVSDDKSSKSSNDKKNTNTTRTQTTTSSQKSTTKEKRNSDNQAETTPKDTIVISIVISESEVPLPPTTIEMEEGDTVLDALIKITKEKGIQMDYRGGRGATAYVEGIANVYEFDRGSGSGWMYRVNGIFPDRGAGVVPLLPGDHVEWLYTTNLGVDLGADLEPFRR